jgi:hypothetical protein
MVFISDVTELYRHSRKMVIVYCDFEASSECLGAVERKYNGVNNNMDRNNGKYICSKCSYKLRYINRETMHYKYKTLDDNLLFNINTDEKAYLLGWIASDGWFNKNQVHIAVKNSDVTVLETLRDIVCKELPIKDINKKTMKTFAICSKDISEDAQRYLGLAFPLESYKKSHIVCFPNLQPELVWYFVRGLMEGDGCICIEKKKYLFVSIASYSINMRLGLCKLSDKENIKCCHARLYVGWYGKNAARFLEKVYNNNRQDLVLTRKYKRYTLFKVLYPDAWKGT